MPTKHIPSLDFGFPYDDSGDLKRITPDTLRQICPAAMEAFEKDDPQDNIGGELELEYLDALWFMSDRPQMENPDDDPDECECWTETNEPELGQWLNEKWDDYAIEFNGRKFIIFCKTDDDEYGLFWSNKDQTWINYNF